MAKTGLHQGPPKAGSIKGSGLHAGTGKVKKLGGTLQTAYTRRLGKGRSR